MSEPSRARIVSALGVIEILAWGSSYYLIAVLAGPIAAGTGWSPASISGGVSIGLLVSGLLAPLVGRFIASRGGRPVLAAGAALLAIGLALLGASGGLGGYYLAWVVLGAGMACSLYDAAFSTLGRIFGNTARGAITRLTLWGGFASTVCWPLSAWLVDAFGWRSACFCYAAIHLFITLPLALLAIPGAVAGPASRGSAPVIPPEPVPVMDLRFLGLAVAGVILATLATIWSVHIVTVLTASGLSVASAIAIGALIGPAQVGVRVLEMLGRERYHPAWTMLASAFAVCAGFALLVFGMPAGLAMVLYGAGNGLWSIVRGTLPLAFFGPARFAATMGRLARPMLIAAAAAPTLGAWMIAALGAQTVLMLMALFALLPLAVAIFLLRTMRARNIPVAVP